MKEIPKTNKTFIKNAIISQNKRIDLRLEREDRDLSITFSQQFGTCFVRLGQTIILATTSCEITEPKISRPNEGIIELSLDLCSGAEKWLDSYQRMLPQEGIQCLRLLERTIRDSKCLDTESLCLVSNEKVWKISCHLICLNFDGNLIESTSIAAIASLSHFKRPDVTVSADKSVKMHSFGERVGLNLTLLHFPFCVSFVLFVENESKYHLICDPLECEEESADACVVIAANSYREIVGIHCSGKAVVDSYKVIKCSQIAIERAKQLTEIIKTSLQYDSELRAKDIESVGFGIAIRAGIMSGIQKPHKNVLDVIKVDKIEDTEQMDELPEEVSHDVYLYGRGIATIGEGGHSKWSFDAPIDVDSDVSNDEIFPLNDNIKQLSKKGAKSDDSEEDEVMILDIK